MTNLNRVYGVVGVEAINSNFNANFDGEPKNINGGQLIASDVALKYAYKVALNADGERVLGLKRVNDKGEVFTLEQTYELLFEEVVTKKTDVDSITSNLLKCNDIKNFGITFAVGAGVGITGAVQIGQGVNVLPSAEIYEENIIAPYSSKNGNTMTTIGSEIRVDKAHYLYNVDINPQQYDKYENSNYTREDFEIFKEYSLDSVTRLNSRTKMGCENHFVMFIEMNEEGVFTPNLRKYIKVIEGDKVEYDLSELKNTVADMTDKIKSIEIYYNPTSLIISNAPEDVEMINITTRKVM